ncbi:amidase [Halobaculum lipolyticum]|uniref:Amidase n=1 Tax=Halobaculum lipolyticum TaxID=3032001 RepID=A0ABD5W4X3_9EURY|nr:amidase [Halobaculum sp. DT31]
MTGEPRSDAARRARRYAERVRRLPGDDTAPAFAPATPARRRDPYDAFATPARAPRLSEGSLSDLRVATKDNVAVAGLVHDAGTGSLGWEPDADAAVVERLRAAGAEFVGTTRMDALALGVTGEACRAGPTENPAAEGCVPGGSSSGSAAAVAGDLADVAVGTDTGGSVRLPAAFCGVVGVKPTYDRVPRTGVLDLAPTLDHVGVLARDVTTAARALDAVSGADPLRPTTAAATTTRALATLEDPLGRLRVGVPEAFVEGADPRVTAAFEATVADLTGLPGVTVERLAFPEHADAAFVNQVHTLAEFARLVEAGGRPVGDGRADGARGALPADVADADVPERVERLVATGRALNRGTDAYADAWDARRRLIRRTQACLDRVDVLVTPTAPVPAPGFGAVGDGFGDAADGSGADAPGGAALSPGDLLANTAPFNCTGNPAVSVPTGTVEGLPIGIQVVGQLGADETALRVARTVESVADETA